MALPASSIMGPLRTDQPTSPSLVYRASREWLSATVTVIQVAAAGSARLTLAVPELDWRERIPRRSDMKRLLPALCMLVMLPMLPASNRATRLVTTVAACEIGQMGNSCDAERSHNPAKLGRPSDHRFRIEAGPVGEIVFAFLTSIIRL